MTLQKALPGAEVGVQLSSIVRSFRFVPLLNHPTASERIHARELHESCRSLGPIDGDQVS